MDLLELVFIYKACVHSDLIRVLCSLKSRPTLISIKTVFDVEMCLVLCQGLIRRNFLVGVLQVYGNVSCSKLKHLDDYL